MARHYISVNDTDDGMVIGINLAGSPRVKTKGPVEIYDPTSDALIISIRDVLLASGLPGGVLISLDTQSRLFLSDKTVLCGNLDVSGSGSFSCSYSELGAAEVKLLNGSRIGVSGSRVGDDTELFNPSPFNPMTIAKANIGNGCRINASVWANNVVEPGTRVNFELPARAEATTIDTTLVELAGKL